MITRDLVTQRKYEHSKYQQCYQLPNYAMGNQRWLDACRLVNTLPLETDGFLDVGCGRGEMLDYAQKKGFANVRGVEVVPDLIDGERVIRGEVHELPFADDSFDVVCMFDVIEHLIPGDDEAACRELERVARKHVFLSANNRPSVYNGMELHINKRPYDEWHELFTSWFEGALSRVPGQYVSELWRVDR